jgi:uncharacterized protein (DUF169 family)
MLRESIGGKRARTGTVELIPGLPSNKELIMSYDELSGFLERRLQLQFQPIAMAFVQEQPQEIPRTEMVLPSSCAFWRQAEAEVFYAAAEDHYRCPIGAMVMGFPLPEQQMQELMSEVGEMCTASYVRETEVKHIPKNENPSTGIVYGPLGIFPLEPDAVLLWLTPQQAMVMNECSGLINWAESADGVFGRPGCAAIPLALAKGKPSQSWGCVGMRLNTDIPGEVFLMVVPGTRLQSLEVDLIFTTEVHQRMKDYYLGRASKPTVAGGSGPTR